MTGLAFSTLYIPRPLHLLALVPGRLHACVAHGRRGWVMRSRILF